MPMSRPIAPDSVPKVASSFQCRRLLADGALKRSGAEFHALASGFCLVSRLREHDLLKPYGSPAGGPGDLLHPVKAEADIGGMVSAAAFNLLGADGSVGG